MGERIIEKCIMASRAREAARKARDLVHAQGRARRQHAARQAGRLLGAATRSSREIYIVEGTRAGGSAKQGRDRRFQAILPLRGKILNVEKARLDKMLGHEEIRALITALGAGIGEDVRPRPSCATTR